MWKVTYRAGSGGTSHGPRPVFCLFFCWDSAQKDRAKSKQARKSTWSKEALRILIGTMLPKLMHLMVWLAGSQEVATNE
jgi:hypothetical protein